MTQTPAPAPAGEPKRAGSDLLRNEDWLAVWIGLAVIVLVLAGVRPALPEFRWSGGAEASSTFVVGELVDFPSLTSKLKQPHRAFDTWLATNLSTTTQTLLGNYQGRSSDSAALQQALVHDLNTLLTGASIYDQGRFAGITLRPETQKLMSENPHGTGLEHLNRLLIEDAYPLEVSRNRAELLGKILSGANLWKMLVLGVAAFALAAAGMALMGAKLGRFTAGFPIVYVLACLAQVIAGNKTVNYWGVEYVIFALVAGLLISNTVGTPAWLMESVRTEFYIKTGLVILGAGMLFGEIMQAGALGMLQALLVVTVVWYFCFWLARRLRVDDEFAVMLSSAVSICGVSAAIATCGAIQGDRRKLSYVTSLVLIVAVPMMIVMPWIVKAAGIPDIVGGAWLGGTLDTSGSVVAAGTLISEPAMKAGVIVKLSQNVLIGVAAFVLSVWWAFRNRAQTGQRVSAAVIWERFPKFILGFLLASLVFSFVLDPALVKQTKGLLSGMRTLWFALAFACIGLETRLTELVSMEGGRPALAFVGAQAFNVIWTLVLAFLLFGGILFAVPQLK